MMKIMLSVQYIDGSGVNVDAFMPDFIAFERKYDRPVASFASDARIEYMCYLAWHALKRQKKTDVEFDQWLDAVAELRVGEEDEIVPLESNPPTGG